MRRVFVSASILVGIFLCVSCTTMPQSQGYYQHANFLHAAQRTEQLVDAINTNQSDLVYEMIVKEYRQDITKEEFVRRFQEDRTYPYLTPLYLHIVSLELPQRSDGHVVCSVAARLEGEYFRFGIRYEDGDYYFVLFEALFDGSYRDKFSHAVVKWV